LKGQSEEFARLTPCRLGHMLQPVPQGACAGEGHEERNQVARARDTLLGDERIIDVKRVETAMRNCGHG